MLMRFHELTSITVKGFMLSLTSASSCYGYRDRPSQRSHRERLCKIKHSCAHIVPIIVQPLYLCRAETNTTLQCTREGKVSCTCYAVMTLVTEVWEDTMETPAYLVLIFLP